MILMRILFIYMREMKLLFVYRQIPVFTWILFSARNAATLEMHYHFGLQCRIGRVWADSELNDDLHCNLAAQQDGGTIHGTVERDGGHWPGTGHPVYDTNLAPFRNESLIAGWM